MLTPFLDSRFEAYWRADVTCAGRVCPSETVAPASRGDEMRSLRDKTMVSE